MIELRSIELNYQKAVLKTLHLHFILKQKPNLVLLITFVDFFCPLIFCMYLWTKIDQWRQ